jgi:hypothetical protein
MRDAVAGGNANDVTNSATPGAIARATQKPGG